MIIWIAISILIIYAIIATCVAVWSIRMNLDYSDKMQEIKEATEESLDVLNTLYQRAATRAQLEVMSDEPVIRELVSDLISSKDAILLVANIIVDPLRDNDEESVELWHHLKNQKLRQLLLIRPKNQLKDAAREQKKLLFQFHLILSRQQLQ